MSRASIHVTKSGIQIGGHYVPPAPMPSEDAETIQRLLIDKPEPRMTLAERALVWFAIAVAVGALAYKWSIL